MWRESISTTLRAQKVHRPVILNGTPTHWNWKHLDEICKGIFDCPHSTPVLTDAGPYLARSQDIRSGVFRLEEAAHVSSETYQERIARAEPRHGDLLYSREGTYFGIAAEIPRYIRVCLGQRMVLLRPDPSFINARFLRFWLNSQVVASYIGGFRDGSVAERLNLSTIRKLPVVVPPLPEQRAIAHILGTLDDKIELNRRMNQTLEEMARALFHSWFVAFDPVRAKAAGRQPAGMDAATAALFPDSFEESELGEIPAGWHFGKVGDLVQIVKRTLDPTAYPEESFDHYSLPAFDAGRNPVVETGAAIKSNKTIVEPGAVLISKLNPHIPRVWLPELSSERRSICSTEFLVVGPNNLSARPFIYALFTSEPFTQAFASLVTGTTGSHQRVSPESLLAMPFVVPAEQVMLRFCRAMAPLFQDRARNRALSMTLATIRETLLPKLLSGEVRVGELGVNAAQAVGATA